MKNKVQMLLTDQQRVSSIRRLLVYMIDSYIITILCYAPILYIQSLGTKEINVSTSLQEFNLQEVLYFLIVSMIISIVYLVILPKKTGQTLGKKY